MSVPLTQALGPMKFLFVFSLFALLGSTSAWADTNCEELDRIADKIGDVVPDFGSGRSIVGRGRVQFYAAPDIACKLPGIFVVPGDLLFAQTEHNGFTKVAYIALRKDRKDVTAWVLTARLKPNGKGIVPGTHSF